MKPFEIFRTGNHTSSKGAALSFSDADLAAIAASYDPANYEAPIVVGHPKTNAPAYGWVKALEVKGDRLVAVPGEVQDDFSEMVRDGRFKTRSVALYRPDQAGNPTPGQYHLRHVGFLGAEPPAVKGLKAVEFSDADDQCLEFADAHSVWNSAWALSNVARLFRGLREYFIETGSIETADKLVPEWDIGQLEQAAADTRADARVQERATFSETTETTEETDMTKTAEQRQAELDAREAAIFARETKMQADEHTFAETTRKAQADADATFVAEQVAAGRVPVDRQGAVTALFSQFADEELTFSEGDQEVKASPREVFRDFLATLPLPVVTGEIAIGDGPDFSDPSYVTAAIQTEIRKAEEKGEKITPAVAAMRLQPNR